MGLHDEFGSVASFWFGRRAVVSLGAVDQLQQHINPNWTSEWPAARERTSLNKAPLNKRNVNIWSQNGLTNDFYVIRLIH